MEVESLTLQKFVELRTRFVEFHDAVFRKIEVHWGPLSQRCELEIDCLDSESENIGSVLRGAFAPHVWSRLVLHIDEMIDFSWQPDWQGSVETTNLNMFEFDKSAAIAVVADERLPVPLMVRDLYGQPARTSFFVEGRHFSYAVKQPIPGADALARSKFAPIFQGGLRRTARVASNAPAEYRPSAVLTLLAAHFVEEGDQGAFAFGSIVWSAEYSDGVRMKVPEEYLDDVSAA